MKFIFAREKSRVRQHDLTYSSLITSRMVDWSEGSLLGEAKQRSTNISRLESTSLATNVCTNTGSPVGDMRQTNQCRGRKINISMSTYGHAGYTHQAKPAQAVE